MLPNELINQLNDSVGKKTFIGGRATVGREAAVGRQAFDKEAVVEG